VRLPIDFCPSPVTSTIPLFPRFAFLFSSSSPIPVVASSCHPFNGEPRSWFYFVERHAPSCSTPFPWRFLTTSSLSFCVARPKQCTPPVVPRPNTHVLPIKYAFHVPPLNHESDTTLGFPCYSHLNSYKCPTTMEPNAQSSATVLVPIHAFQHGLFSRRRTAADVDRTVCSLCFTLLAGSLDASPRLNSRSSWGHSLLFFLHFARSHSCRVRREGPPLAKGPSFFLFASSVSSGRISSRHMTSNVEVRLHV